MSEAVPESIYNQEIRDRQRIEEAASVGGLVSSYILRTAVQLELPYNEGKGLSQKSSTLDRLSDTVHFSD